MNGPNKPALRPEYSFKCENAINSLMRNSMRSVFFQCDSLKSVRRASVLIVSHLSPVSGPVRIITHLYLNVCTFTGVRKRCSHLQQDCLKILFFFPPTFNPTLHITIVALVILCDRECRSKTESREWMTSHISCMCFTQLFCLPEKGTSGTSSASRLRFTYSSDLMSGGCFTAAGKPGILP